MITFLVGSGVFLMLVGGMLLWVARARKSFWYESARRNNDDPDRVRRNNERKRGNDIS